jgi:hypothetical protein
MIGSAVHTPMNCSCSATAESLAPQVFWSKKMLRYNTSSSTCRRRSCYGKHGGAAVVCVYDVRLPER